MAKFCGKCGSKLDKHTGKCPNCDASIEISKSIKQSKYFFRKIVIAFVVLVVLSAIFLTLDYFDVIGVGVSKTIGLKPMGTFEIYSDTNYIFTSSDSGQEISFYCIPEKGYAPELKGDFSGQFFDDGNAAQHRDVKKRDGVYTASIKRLYVTLEILKNQVFLKTFDKVFLTDFLEKVPALRVDVEAEKFKPYINNIG